MSMSMRDFRPGSIYGEGSTFSHRDKSLPPLPPEAGARVRTPSDLSNGNGNGNGRPNTYFDARTGTVSLEPQHGQFLSPSGSGSGSGAGGSRGQGPEGRRQSFGGMASRPEGFAQQTLPASATYARSGFAPDTQTRQQHGGMGYNQQGQGQGQGQGHYSTVGQMGQGGQMNQMGQMDGGYNEFGYNRPSMQEFGPSQESTLTGPRKRRSRFALSSLFGKKSPVATPVVGHGQLGHAPGLGNGYLQGQAPGQGQGYANGMGMGGQPGQSPYGYAAEGNTGNGYASYPPSSEERHMDYGRPVAGGQSATMGGRGSFSAQGQGMGQGQGNGRMSVASRKAIEELVDQDREFVAYRYPSASDQRTYDGRR
jgi:hypothetical protein